MREKIFQAITELMKLEEQEWTPLMRAMELFQQIEEYKIEEESQNKRM